MKIAILTWLHNGNYGSILQAYALQKFIEINGYEVEDIDYNPSAKTKLVNWITNFNSIDLFKEKLDIKIRKKKGNVKELEKRLDNIDSFRNKYIKTTKKCDKTSDLKKIQNEFDIFICGSDQIWSPRLMNPNFYFSFLNENKYRIAYAPSLGVTSVSRIKRNKIKRLISKFDKISVREETGANILKELTDKDVSVQIDPTLLLHKTEWSKIAKFETNEKYILCYLLTENKDYIEIVRKKADDLGCKVIVILTDVGPFNTGFEEKSSVSPEEWLGLVKNSELVMTDSFHGLIFSAIFNRDFYIFKRFSNDDKKSQNSRIFNIAKLLNVENRIVGEDGALSNDKIDYEFINKIIEEERINSGKWLINSVEEGRNGKYKK